MPDSTKSIIFFIGIPLNPSRIINAMKKQTPSVINIIGVGCMTGILFYSGLFKFTKRIISIFCFLMMPPFALNEPRQVVAKISNGIQFIILQRQQRFRKLHLA